jgi:hypothetical protein
MFTARRENIYIYIKEFIDDMYKSNGMGIPGKELCPGNDVMLMKITNGFLKRKSNDSVCYR